MDKRSRTKAGRSEAFKAEQEEALDRCQLLIKKVREGNVLEAEHALKLVKVSLEYMYANDPSYDK